MTQLDWLENHRSKSQEWTKLKICFSKLILFDLHIWISIWRSQKHLVRHDIIIDIVTIDQVGCGLLEDCTINSKQKMVDKFIIGINHCYGFGISTQILWCFSDMFNISFLDNWIYKANILRKVMLLNKLFNFIHLIFTESISNKDNLIVVVMLVENRCKNVFIRVLFVVVVCVDNYTHR